MGNENLYERVVRKNKGEEKFKMALKTLNKRVDEYFNVIAPKEIEDKMILCIQDDNVISKQINIKLDIYFIIVFKDIAIEKCKNMLISLSEFVKYYYKNLEIYRLYPVSIIILNNIKFGLISAYKENGRLSYNI